MAQRSHVPKFGNWESEENVPYTAYFEKARKGRTSGGMINPNDPQGNPEAFSDNGSPVRAPPSQSRAEDEEPIGQGAIRPAHERRTSREDGEMRQFADSPARHENMGRRASNETTNPRPGGRIISSGEPQRKPVRQSVGSEHSIERSPLHPHYQAKITGRGSNSPSREGKNSTDSIHGTPGRSRMKAPGRGDEDPDKGAAVPKFGEWDENNPSSADGFTHIFNKVREERQTGAVRVPGMGAEPSYNAGRKQNTDGKAKSCCFPWSRK